MAELSISIRREQRDDYDRVHEIEERAFGEPDEALQVAALRGRVDPEISLVAATPDEHGKQRLIAHIYFSPVKVGAELRDSDSCPRIQSTCTTTTRNTTEHSSSPS